MAIMALEINTIFKSIILSITLKITKTAKSLLTLAAAINIKLSGIAS